MHGVRLRDLDSPDMVDVIHYIFEEDLDVATAEQAEARDNYRNYLYGDLYNTPYRYASTKSKMSTNYDMLDDPLDDMLVEDSLTDVDIDIPAVKKPPKPYVPPTNFNPNLENPFAGSKLDAPLN